LENIWARKSTTDLLQEAAQGELDAETRPLKRSLSALNLVALGIGGIIGAGIFVLTGHAAAANAGPAVTLSFLSSPARLPDCATPRCRPPFRSVEVHIPSPMRRSAN
jgi:hypothetical protein